jgi:hemerythrin superfamily protein
MQAATEEKHDAYIQFATKIIAHAQNEEEMLYPAAILVGEYIKLKLGIPRVE